MCVGVCRIDVLSFDIVVLLFKVELSSVGVPVRVPPLKLNVAEVSTGDAFSVPPFRLNVVPETRSEERRVGKECRYGKVPSLEIEKLRKQDMSNEPKFR